MRIARLLGPLTAGGLLIALLMTPGASGAVAEEPKPSKPDTSERLQPREVVFTTSVEPAEARPQRQVEALDYGTLVHRAVERFYRAHGQRFLARSGPLEPWLAEADRAVESVFAAFLEEYPLVGAAVQGRERERLREDVRNFLRHDWSGGARQFVAVERAFGYPRGVPLTLPNGRLLHVRGHIDRIDVEEGLTLVRDLKTGTEAIKAPAKANPR